MALRHAGKKVVTATWPGADGLDIRLPPGSPTDPILQSSSRRMTDYTVPFGAFGGVGAQGFSLTAADFSPAPTTTTDQLTAAGRTSFSPILQKTSPLETFTVGGVTYTILVAALDTTDDQRNELRHACVLRCDERHSAGAVQPALDGPGVRAG